MAYVLELAAEYLAEHADPDGVEDRYRHVELRLGQLHDQKHRVARSLAESDKLDTLTDVLADINNEIQTLEAENRELERHDQMRIGNQNLEDQLQRLAQNARSRLADPTTELMTSVFDVLQLDLVRVGDDRFEGTGSIPVLRWR